MVEQELEVGRLMTIDIHADKSVGAWGPIVHGYLALSLEDINDLITALRYAKAQIEVDNGSETP